MRRKSFFKLFVTVLVLCLAACVFVACNKNKGNDTPTDYRPGDVVVSEKDVTWTVGPDGEIIMGEYVGKDVVVKYLLDNSSYLVLSGHDLDDMAIEGYHGEIKSFTLKDIENKVNVNGSRISVTSIKANTFQGCETLEKVDLTKSSRALSFEVGDGAFAYCTSLKSVVLPQNLYVNDNSIGESAFERCEQLNSVTIGDKFTVIGQRAFAFCKELPSITLPATIKNIADSTFYGCEKLSKFGFIGETEMTATPDEKDENDTTTDVPNRTVDIALKTIGSYAFANTAISNGNFEKFTNLRVIGTGAFNNTAISEITIPDNVSIISSGAFYGLEALRSVDIPFLGTTITGVNNSWSFNSVYGYNRNVLDTLDRNVTVRVRGTLAIPAGTFNGCTDVAAVNVKYLDLGKVDTVKVYNSDGITFTEYASSELAVNPNIDENSFRNCSKLSTLTLSKQPEYIGGHAFDGCEKLTTFPISEVEYIGNCAFANCYALSEITIPSSVRYMGSQVFADCTALSSIEIESLCYNYTDENDRVSEYSNLSALPQYFAGSSSLDMFELEEKMYLTSSRNSNGVWVPKALKSVKVGNAYYIPANMFDGFSGLTNIEVTMTQAPQIADYTNSDTGKIGAYAFYNCSSLTNLTINDENGVITAIGESAFDGCTSLDEFDVPQNVTAIGSYAFRNTAITSFTLPASIEYSRLGNGILADCVRLASIEIKDYDKAVRAYPDDSYYYNYETLGSLSRLFATSTVLDEQDYLVYDENLGMILSESFPLYRVNGSYSAYVPKTLKTVKLGSTTMLAANAFYGFSSLTTIEVEFVDNLGTLQYVDGNDGNDIRPWVKNQAFANCTELSTLTFTGETVASTNVGNGAFTNCESLEVLPVTLPMTYNFVNGCTSLKELTIRVGESDTSRWYLANVFSAFNVYDNSLLEEYSNLTKVTLTTGFATPHAIPAYILNGAANVTELVIGGTIYAVGEHALTGSGITVDKGEYLGTFNDWAVELTASTSFIVVPSDIKGFASGVGTSRISNVFFEGTSEQWENVKKGGNFNNANVYFYTEEEPIYSGNYWHYNTDGSIQVYGGGTFGVVTYTFVTGYGENLTVRVEGDLQESDIPELPEVEDKIFVRWYPEGDSETTLTFPYSGTARVFMAEWRDPVSFTIDFGDGTTQTIKVDEVLTSDVVYPLPAYSEGTSFMAATLYTDVEKSQEVTFPYAGEYGYTLYLGYAEVANVTFPSNYAFTYDAANDAYSSSNQNQDNTTSSFTIVAQATIVISLDYLVDSESSYDKLSFVKVLSNGGETTEGTYSGSNQSGKKTITLQAGESLRIQYSKDGSQKNGSDTATISNIVINRA